MKIVIIGSGQVGIDLSLMLSHEKQDVTVLDQDRDALKRCTEHNDILVIEGNATSPADLVAAGVDKADLVIAATNVDEINMVASMMSKRLGAKKVIARIRSEELTKATPLLTPSDLGIDVIINPELSLATEIVQLVKRVAASDLIELADGRVQVIGIRLPRGSQLIGMSLSEYTDAQPNIEFRVVAIYRGGITIIPNGSTKLRANDQVFIISLTKNIKQVIRSTGMSEQHIRRIMIAGGTRVGQKVAQLLHEANSSWKIKLIEPDYDLSYKTASENRDILVLNGDPTDPSLLVSEGIMETDVFIAVTDDEESNIISCLMAKHLQVQKVIAMVSKPDYIPLSQTIGLDSSVNKKTSVANEIHRLILGTNLLQVATLSGIDAEILEIKIKDKTRLFGKKLIDLRLPDGSVVGGITRNNTTFIATGNSTIELNDSILVFCQRSKINEVTKYFL